MDGRYFKCEGRGAIFSAEAPWQPVLRMGANRCQRAGLCARGRVLEEHSLQVNCHFASRVVFRNRGFIRDNVAVIYEQTAGRAAGELATYRRSAAAAVVGIPAAGLRPASFWAT